MGNFTEARETMRDELRYDEGLRIGYISNIAMLLHDKYGITGYEERNAGAEDILNLIFGE
jgi:hypothetical protein